MNTLPRVVCPVRNVEQLPPEQLIVKYMSIKKFEDLIDRAAMYFRRIDGFRDTLEGDIPAAVWALNSEAIQQWYEREKARIFVCCWNLDSEEMPHMWTEYAERSGVRISSTVGTLTAELSFPAPPEPPPLDPKIAEYLQKVNAVAAEVDETPKDGFTLGKIKYVNARAIENPNAAEVHEMLSEGPSNTVPAFRKTGRYAHENEFRAILRSWSASGDASASDLFSYVAVRLENLIHEIRFAPVDDAELQQAISAALASKGLNIPVNPAALGLKKSDLAA